MVNNELCSGFTKLDLEPYSGIQECLKACNNDEHCKAVGMVNIAELNHNSTMEVRVTYENPKSCHSKEQNKNMESGEKSKISTITTTEDVTTESTTEYVTTESTTEDVTTETTTEYVTTESTTEDVTTENTTEERCYHRKYS